jgi:tRNA nucleotidyltransferase (CCA-adding enzyme)
MEVYLVGGAVRDTLLGYPVHERDWVVVGSTPQELLAQGYQQVGRDFPVFLHPQTKEEYALARTERKQGHGYQGFVCNSDPSVTLEQDLSRRDLTINAMARSDDGQLVDPYGGERDLQQRILRHVSQAFVEDPLRVLRVARFASRYHHLGFTVAAQTRDLMHQVSSSGELQYLASERIWVELERAIGQDSPGTFFSVLLDCGALPLLLPELELKPQQLAALDRAAAITQDSGVRLAALLGNSGTEAAQDCLQRLKPPVHHRDLVRLCSELLPLYKTLEPHQAENVLELLTRADAFRRPERFEQLLLACQAASDQKQAGDLLRHALHLCDNVDVKSIAQPGLSGKEIGQRLQAARLSSLSRLADVEDQHD